MAIVLICLPMHLPPGVCEPVGGSLLEYTQLEMGQYCDASMYRNT